MNRLRRAGKVSKFLLAMVGTTIFGNKPPKPPEGAVFSVDDLETYVNNLVEMSRPPGLSLVVLKDGDTVYQKSFGLADGPNNIAATPDTVFQWMSMTKMTTAVAIVQLHERKVLNIGDPVVKHLPFFKVQHPSDGGEQVTIRHLLNHSSGLANPPGMLGLIHLEDEPYPDQVELVKRLVAENSKLKFEPGTQGTYTNLGYTVLGAIVEVVSGRPHHEYVAEHIFRPLKMENTNHIYTGAMRANAAVGSQPNGNIMSVMLPIAIDDPDALIRETVNGRMWFKPASPDFSGAAGVNGPAVDTARFAAAFLNGGELNGERILSPESIAMMIQDEHIVAKGGPASFYKGVRHGLGWWIWPDGHRQRIMHSGDGPGFSNIMQLYPEEGLGVIVMGNEWAYGVAFRGTAIRDSIAHLAASIDWR
jgi:CubicO group peptidase (beta-lactamase class C family)